MFELTEQQRQELNEQEPVAVNPETQEEYILVKRQTYQQMKALLEDTLDIRDAYPLMDAVAAKMGWNDPAMNIYDDLARNCSC
ncbi:MAG TPA: hypothetical protein VE988_13480 [Gemmataceae bacterium]|nr:hypothetical protein [Gemmataceae bacterium]